MLPRSVAWVRSLHVDGLRNLATQEVQLSAGLNLLCGANAEGKSNFLEAVALACTARSFRQSSNAEMIRFGDTSASVAVQMEGASPTSLRLALDRRHKYAFVNRRRVTELAGYLAVAPPVVVFRNESLAICRGGPEYRRQFLDQLLLGCEPAILGVLRRYRRALVQRNSALKEGWGRAELLGFERELALSGVSVLRRRLRLVEALEFLAAEFQRQFREALALRYRDTLELPDLLERSQEESAEHYLETLGREREEDRRQGFTRKGPHRDELELDLDGVSVRRYGSQGQARSVVLALKVAAIELLTRARGLRPLLLLDDVGTDLDEERRERLLDSVARDLQAFVSTTEAAVLGFEQERIHRFQVRGGKLLVPS